MAHPADLAPLGRKQSSAQPEWEASWAAISEHPDHGRACELVESAAASVRERISDGGRYAYAWSGGKDAQGIRAVMEAAGVETSVLVLSRLEFPSVVEWIGAHCPDSLHIEVREGIDLDWLKAHPAMLFPQGPNGSRWYGQVQLAGQRAWGRRAGIDGLFTGHRRADGNFIGGEGRVPGVRESRDPGGYARITPISEWSHEDLLHVLVSYSLPLAPYYLTARGFRVGSGPWPARVGTSSLAQGWAEVAEIDPGVVEHAARHDLPGARDFLATA